MILIARRLIFTLIIGTLTLVPVSILRAGVQEEINARNRQIEEIQRQIDQYQQQIEQTSTKARTLSGEISTLNAQIKQIELQIKSLGLEVEETRAEIIGTQAQIIVAERKLELHKSALAQYIRILNQTDRENLTALLFKNRRLSDFFNNLKNLQDTQAKAQTSIVAIKEIKTELEQKKADLESKQEDLQRLKSLQVAAQRDVQSQKKTKDQLLKETKGQETRYQELVKRSQQDISRIRDQIFYLEQNGVTVDDAIKFGQLAAIAVGIRPAFLIAILEVESGLGRNVGTGNWLNDMYNCYKKLGQLARAEKEKDAFFQIINKLGLNPDTVRVSREPNYGCGGALGPAQFLPTTWLGYEEEVARLTDHNPPSPWNIEDAFTASAAKLARAGATKKTRAGEIAAAKAYISGSAACVKRICNSYANAVLSKAAAIGQSL
ncbi:MAG: lytic murein transglycosylase [Patescibacteria group bacterium]